MAPYSGRQSASRGPGQRSNGVLSVPASATQKPNILKSENMPTRVAAPRLKLVIRRLPPGMTEAEFEATLGEDWKVDGGKADWLLYKPGKISKR